PGCGGWSWTRCGRSHCCGASSSSTRRSRSRSSWAAARPAVNAGALTVGGLVGFVALFTVLLWPILSLGFLFAFAQETASACDRIGELLDAPNTVTDRPGVRPAAIGSPARLRFEDAGFTYPGSTTPVLDGGALAP